MNQSKDEKLKWKRFVQNNMDLINKSGLPLEYYDNENIWIDFLEHGYIDYHKDEIKFSIDDCTEAEYKNFKKLVKSYFNNGFTYFLVTAFKYTKDVDEIAKDFQ